VESESNDYYGYGKGWTDSCADRQENEDHYPEGRPDRKKGERIMFVIDQLIIGPPVVETRYAREEPMRVTIVDMLRESKKTLSLSEIAETIGKSKSNVTEVVRYLARTHRIIKVGDRKPYRYRA